MLATLVGLGKSTKLHTLDEDECTEIWRVVKTNLQDGTLADDKLKSILTVTNAQRLPKVEAHLTKRYY